MMKNSGCVAGCLDAQVPTRTNTFERIHRWPDSEAEFVRVMRNKDKTSNPRIRREYVDGYSCRQMYLRSYTFSREESDMEKTKKCIGKVKCLKKMRDKLVENYRAAMAAIFHRLLSCTTSVDVKHGSRNHHNR